MNFLTLHYRFRMIAKEFLFGWWKCLDVYDVARIDGISIFSDENERKDFERKVNFEKSAIFMMDDSDEPAKALSTE